MLLEAIPDQNKSFLIQGKPNFMLSSGIFINSLFTLQIVKCWQSQNKKDSCKLTLFNNIQNQSNFVMITKKVTDI